MPGVSGSVLAVLLNVYYETISRINNIFDNFKDNLRYFSLLGIGIFVSITIGSKVVLYLYNMYQSFMLILFIGLLSCSLIKLYIILYLSIVSTNDILY